MKKLIVTVIAIALSASACIFPALAADNTNLLPNNSVETVANGNPANWIPTKWGNNSAELSYKIDGHTGSRSLHVEMKGHIDGDSKWMHTPISAKKSTSYTYSSWYKSNTTTEVDIQYTNAAGVTSYAYIGWLPASADWKQFSMEFTTPADADRMSVMHIIAMNGWLQTDDFELIETPLSTTDSSNLVANGSLETANGTNPIAWNTNTWGSNTAKFDYNTTGRDSGRSVTVTISKYTSGDAKWYANPVSITGGASYIYRDYYKSTINSRVVAAYIDANGNYSYVELPSTESASDWTEYTTTFTAPIGATKVSIFHIIDDRGSLTLDDVSIKPEQVAPIEVTIPNASMEIAKDASTPEGWRGSNWGTNTVSYQYLNEGHNSSRSTKVTINSYTDGDAKWMFDPITTLEPGQQYRFSTWYKTNVIPQPVAMFNMADGSTRYFGMPTTRPAADSAANWQYYTDTFSVPEGTVSASIFLFINQVGWLQTDDYRIVDYKPTGFNRPLLSLTFDDGHEDNVTTALPLLNQYGFKTTQCYATRYIEGKPKAITDGVKAFYNSGHEICSHTVSHPFMTSLNSTDLTYELEHSKTYLENLVGVPVRNFATPYGDYDARVVNEIKKHYQSHRSVDEGYNSKDNFDSYNIRVQNILSTTTADQVNRWIAKAQADKTWLVLVYHRVANDPGPYDSYIDDFAAQLSVIKASGITVMTYQDALTETTSQL